MRKYIVTRPMSLTVAASIERLRVHVRMYVHRLVWLIRSHVPLGLANQVCAECKSYLAAVLVFFFLNLFISFECPCGFYYIGERYTGAMIRGGARRVLLILSLLFALARSMQQRRVRFVDLPREYVFLYTVNRERRG